MNNLLIKNIRIIDPNQDFIGFVFIEDGKISRVFEGRFAKMQSFPPGIDPETIIDGESKILFPGCFDPHVHFRDPGFTHKEDFESGSKAAVSAGVTTIFDMPNTNPPVFTYKNLAKKREIVKPKAYCNYGLFFGAGPNNLEEIKAVKNIPGVKLYLNTTTGNLKMDNENMWREIFKLGKKVALHAEGNTFFRAVEIWKEEGFPCELHLCHASLKSEIDKIRDLKNNPKSREKISVEVCPHHLFMTHKEREKHGAICCMKPELATQKDLDTMWEAVEDGTIDFFATDHAPHTLEEKKESDKPGKNSVYGIPGVETFLPLLFTEFIKRGYTLQKLAAMTSKIPRKKYHVKDLKGEIKEGFDADLIIIDENRKEKISAKNFFSKSKWTPFSGREITMKVEKTLINGEIVFDDGNILKQEGQEISFDAY
jgi:dihydroorotase